MRRGYVAFFALTLVGVGLTGCGLFRFEQREPWRAQAEEACMAQNLVQPSAYMSRTSKIDGPGACGMDYPFKIAAFSGGTVGLKQKVTLACPIIPHIETWLDEVVKPAAVLYFGVPVVDLKAGSYSCRTRNNQTGAKASEHAYGNALDVMSFTLADGREVAVVKGWRGDPTEQEFLREVFAGACRYFTTVLGPGADPFHYDHLHIDLARHDPRGDRHICKPILKFTPRLDALQANGPGRRAAHPSADLQPIDVEEDGWADERPSAPGPFGPSGRSTDAADPPPRAPAVTYPPVAPRGAAPNPYLARSLQSPAPPMSPYQGPTDLQRPIMSGHGLY